MNGNLVAQVAGRKQGVEKTSGNLTIGVKMYFDGTVVAYWSGRMDSVRVFDYPLTEKEIKKWLTDQ